MGLFNLFSRVLGIGDAIANDQLDKVENNNSEAMMKQDIAKLEECLTKSNEALIKVKASEIGNKTEAQQFRTKAEEFKKKATEYLTMAMNKEIEQAEADAAADECLKNMDENLVLAEKNEHEAKFDEKQVKMLDEKIKELKSNIKIAKEAIENIVTRKDVATSVNTINAQLSDTGAVNNAMNRIKQFRTNVEKIEFEGMAYDELKDSHETATEKLNKKLAESKSKSRLADFKASLSQPTATPVS